MGLNLKRAMRARNMRSKDLAALMGVCPDTITNISHGNVSVCILEKIAKVLDCDVIELFDEPKYRRLPKLDEKGRPIPIVSDAVID